MALNRVHEGTGSLEKAIDVLDAVTGSPGGLGQAEITQRLALPRTTVYRLLATLVGRGLLRRDPLRKVYCLGPRCFEMARQAHAAPDLVAAASPELRALRDLTGETTYLAVLEGAEVVSLDRHDGAHSERSAAALGQRKPVHCTSQGKAILSAMPAAECAALMRDLVLRPLTPFTITDRRRLLAELKLTAARGWAMDDEEIVIGVRCVGAPVVDPRGEVRGAISVAGPAWRVTRERANLLGPEVADAARRIGSQLRPAVPAPGDPSVRPVDGPWAFHGAFPRWCGQTQSLYWADTLAPAVRVLAGGVDRQLCPVESPITGLLLLGEHILVMHRAGVLRVTREGRSAPVTTWPPGELLAACNTPEGRIWAALRTASGGSLLGQIQPGARFEPVCSLDEPVQALCWDPLQAHLVAAAPESGALLLVRPGSPTVRRLTTIPQGSGRVSGLAMDTEGGTWLALRQGWGVVRVSADGELDRLIGLPVPSPTDVAVGGPDGRLLHVTTARQDVALDVLAKAPHSGALFVVAI